GTPYPAKTIQRSFFWPNFSVGINETQWEPPDEKKSDGAATLTLVLHLPSKSLLQIFRKNSQFKKIGQNPHAKISDQNHQSKFLRKNHQSKILRKNHQSKKIGQNPHAKLSEQNPQPHGKI